MQLVRLIFCFLIPSSNIEMKPNDMCSTSTEIYCVFQEEECQSGTKCTVEGERGADCRTHGGR